MTSVPVRLAGPGDPCLPELAAIEDAGEVLFAGHLDTSGWAPAVSGHERVDQPGFLLVAGDPVVGFAHVLDLHGHAHLEQLSVHPDHGRRGIGQALVRAVLRECARRGIASITLCTFAEIPWNGPFYTRLGFREIEEASAPGPIRGLRRHEREAGLDRGGRRVVMRAAVATDAVVPRPAVSVIPLRDGPEGLEVFVQHRQSTMDFAAGAVVFPGGRCDPEDVAKGAALPLPEEVVAEHVHRWRRLRREGSTTERARTLVATGLRELAEETGMRAEPTALVPWDCWVTPPTSPKRFDVAFFVLHVPAGGRDQPSHRTSEATDSAWAPVRRVLRDQEVGRLTLLTPTRVLLRELADFGDVATVLERRPVVLGEVDDAPGARPRVGDTARPGTA